MRGALQPLRCSHVDRLEACRGYCALRIGYQPSNLEHSAGRITRPLRGSGVRYQGINVAMLWSAAIAKGYAAPIQVDVSRARVSSWFRGGAAPPIRALAKRVECGGSLLG